MFYIGTVCVEMEQLRYIIGIVVWSDWYNSVAICYYCVIFWCGWSVGGLGDFRGFIYEILE